MLQYLGFCGDVFVPLTGFAVAPEPKQANRKVSPLGQMLMSSACGYVRAYSRISPDSTTTIEEMEYHKTERTALVEISPSF